MADGIAEPTATPVQVTAALAMSVFDPPAVPMDNTLKAGAAGPFGPTGRVSVRSMVSPLVMRSGPLFFTLTVQMTVPPMRTEGALTVFVSARSYWHGSQSILSLPSLPGSAPAAVVMPAAPLMDTGATTVTVGDAAATQLEPPPPPPPLTLLFTVLAPPPPPVYPAPPPAPES